MNTAEFFIKQLESTMELIEHSILIMPEERHKISPPHYTHPNIESFPWIKSDLGEWSALKILHHLVFYEESILTEMMRYVSDAGKNKSEEEFEKEELDDFKKSMDINILLERFKVIRKKQIEFLRQINEYQLNDKLVKTTYFGTQYLNFVLNKTLQHTITHGAKLYVKAIFWDGFWNFLEQ